MRLASGLLATAALAIVMIVIVVAPSIPLGSPGEWVWNRVLSRPEWFRFVLPIVGALLYAGFAWLGASMLGRRSEGWLCLLFPLLLIGGAGFQWTLFELPKSTLGLERWPAALYFPASSGYFTAAKGIKDSREFAKNYASWIADQDSFHIGTHPPGLILANRALLEWFGNHPDAARTLVENSPLRFRQGMQALGAPLAPADQATLTAVALATWLGGLVTMIPIYVIARMRGLAPAAWTAAAIWPMVPGLAAFLPLADGLYPLIAATAVALVALAMETRLSLFAVLGGFVLSVGLFISLAFIPVLALIGILTTLALVRAPRITFFRWLATLIGVTAGVLLPIEWCYHELHLNLAQVWRINLEKHVGFYEAMQRSYGKWIWINLVEFAIVCGPAATAACVACIISLVPRRSWDDSQRTFRSVGELVVLSFLATLVLLDLSGRNLSEAGRLWLFLCPFACVAVSGMVARDSKHGRTAILVLCQAAVAMAVAAAVEPLLPVHGG